MLAVGLLPFLAFAMLAFVPMFNDPLDDVVDDDGMDGEDPIDGGDGEDGDGDDIEAPLTTTISLTDVDGNETEVVLDDDDVTDGEPIDVDGTEFRDVVEAPDQPSVAVNINTFGGDDAVSFGFSTSVDPGEGSDVLTLTLTEAALSAGTLEAGTVTFNDPADALAIEIEDAAEGFIHEVRVQSSENVDDTTGTETETLFYILSDSETLAIDQEASLAAGRVVFEGDTQVLVEVDLGTETTVTGMDEAGEATETVTGNINDDPTIMLNRDVTSEQTITLPTTDAADEEEEGEEPADPAVTIATDGGEPTEVVLEDGRTANGTDSDDEIVATENSLGDLEVNAGDGDDIVTLKFGQDVDLTGGEVDGAIIEEGEDNVTYQIDAASVADALATNEAATAPAEFADSAIVKIGPSDVLTFDIEPTVEGRLVRVDISTFFVSNDETTADDAAVFFLIPDGVDVQAAIDANENGAPDNTLDFLIEDFGAVKLASVDLGGLFDGPDEDTDTRFELVNVVADRAIEAFEFENVQP